VFKNYLMTAVRSFARYKLYSFINVSGLALGLACVIFVMLFVRDETSYDKWVPNHAQLYRMESIVNIPGRDPLYVAVAPFPVSAAMRDQIPEVQAQARMRRQEITLTHGSEQFPESVDVVDPQFLEVVQLPLISGDPSKVLSQPDSLVLSQSTARKIFGDTDPIGQTLIAPRRQCPPPRTLDCLSSTVSLKITGVLRDVPSNSQLLADVLLPNTSLADPDSQGSKQNWLDANYYAYLLLAPGASPDAVIGKLAPIMDQTTAAALRERQLDMRGSEFFKMHLTAFQAVHLEAGRYENNLTPAGNWLTVYGTAVVGAMILLIACFNFTNLATARATLRAQEISLRKCVGATRKQLIVQFLGESMLMAIGSLLLALALVEMLLPACSSFLERPVEFHYWRDWRLTLLILGCALGAGLISGSYPALVLSSFRPGQVLRSGTSSRDSGSGRLRVVLVVMQFAVSIGLGIAAAVVLSQIRYARAMELGFDKDNIVILTTDKWFPSARESFQKSLRAHPGVISTALSSTVPFAYDDSVDLVQLPGQSDVLTLNKIMISPDFPVVYGIPLIAGRLFEAGREADTLRNDSLAENEGHNILINEAAAARFGYTPQEAVGKTIVYNRNHVNIVGVLADFKINGASEPVKPTVYFNDDYNTNRLSIRLRGEDIPAALKLIDESWHRVSPNVAPQPYFLTERFSTLYRAQEKQGVMFEVFVGLAVFVACLGFFGLAVFTAERRTKEIGLRKVLGASTHDVVRLLLWQFSIPVLIANLIAWPLAWLYLHHWLEGFAYRISLNPLYFVGAGLVALLIAWATVFAHAQRVARASPISALRYE
jgi:putative ABC transport system permease protein